MMMPFLDTSAEWTHPIFKVLANNDTGNSPGHQGGIVIPESIRYFFPEFPEKPSASNPTVDQIITAELFSEETYLTTVSTRYQLQTWGGARTPEARITGQLGKLRNRAKGGDLLIIQQRMNAPNHIRLTLIRQSNVEFPNVVAFAKGRRWGVLFTVNNETPTAAVVEEVESDIALASRIDSAHLPYWASVAYIARCARRFLECYENDPGESSAQRALVAQSVQLAETMAAIGGAPESATYLELSGQYFDSYDLDAIASALIANENAAINTWSDLQEDEDLNALTRRILAAISLARLAFACAFPSDPSLAPSGVCEFVQSTVTEAIRAESSTEVALVRDFERLVEQVSMRSLGQWDPVPPSVFGELWPDGRPFGWPIQKLSFRPRARIIRTIGDRLVSGPEAAVIELVKNSYDADASYARITFFPALEIDKGGILFEDDGHGMTLSDIEQKWMEPATSDKRDRTHTISGRRLLGSKGIGRFAASRLGRYLELISTAVVPAEMPTSISRSNRPAQRLTTTRIPELDWNAFEETKYLDDVAFSVESLAPQEATGTSLKILSLRDEWSEQRIKKLHEELRKLVSPIALPNAKAFRIFLDISRCTIENCSFDGNSILGTGTTGTTAPLLPDREPFEVHPFPLLDACDYALDGVFDESGRFEGTFTVQRGGLEPETIRLDVPLRLENDEEACGVVLVRLHVFDREANAIRGTATKAGFGAIGIREARKLLDNIAGVAIYREGFRIRPYGDSENDWLSLDAKRVQNPTMRIGRNQIAGIISLDDEIESRLIERSSREGLEENGSFRRLRALISTLLAEVVEPKRRQFRVSSGLDSSQENSFRDIYDRVQMGWSKLLLAKIPEADRPEAEELIAKESERLMHYVKRLEDRQAQMEARVTLGLIVGEVMHQGNTPLSFLETEAVRLRRWWPSLLDASEKSNKRLLEVPRILNGMEASGEKLRILFNALNPLSGARRGAPKEYDPHQTVEQTLYLFKSKMDKLGINVTFEPETPHRLVIGYHDDLATAVTNLVDNAIYWLEYHSIVRPTIMIAIAANDDRCHIRIADNGVGIPEEFSGQLFDVGFTLKPNGTGLGLSIAKEAILRSSGDLQLAESSKGTIFEISLPYADKANPIS